MTQFLGDTALVIGSGVGGLLTAKVLADRFRRVIVVERDPEPINADPRDGAPQGHHPHSLLRRGQDAMEVLFPGFTAALLAKGAVHLDQGTEVEVSIGGVRGVPFTAPYKNISMTRGLLELTLRALAAQTPNVSFRYDTTAEDLLLTDGRVTGVRVRCADIPETVAADFVADASGRAAQAMKWLTAGGYDSPKETAVGLDFGYATAMFDMPPGFNESWRLLFCLPKMGPDGVGGAIFEVEGRRWMCAIAGRGHLRPTNNPDAFLEHAKRSLDPRFYYWLSRASRTGQVKTYRFAASTRRHYEALTAHPKGFLAIGDALCSFNPVYGQGMSVTALEAEALRDLIVGRPSTDGLWRDFYPRASVAIDTAWKMALDLDLQYPETVYPRPAGYAIWQRVLPWANDLILGDPIMRAKVFEMANMTNPAHSAVSLTDLLGAQWRRWTGSARPPEMARAPATTAAAL
jgi:2-polyprenyl-6-methoxyphenol hydroxylase-like FAD-dependent oxidoreductase